MKSHFNSKIIKVLKVLHIIPKDIQAFTFGQHVFFEDKTPAEWLIKHEAVHVKQFKEHGIFKFLWIYFIVERKLPYKEKSFEVEAYKISSP